MSTCKFVLALEKERDREIRNNGKEFWLFRLDSIHERLQQRSDELQKKER